MKITWIITLSIASFLFNTVNAQTKSKAKKPAGLQTIKLEDLKKDVYAMADPHFNGRAAGTIDELKASMWFAERMRASGILPGGDDGTYFQVFSMQRYRISPASSVAIGNHQMKLWSDVLIAQLAPAQVSAPVVYLGESNKLILKSIDVQGKAVAIKVVPNGINLNVSLPEWRYSRQVMTKYGNDLIEKGAAAVIFISDEYAEHSWPYAKANLIRGTFSGEGTVPAPLPKAPVLWLHSEAEEWIKSEGLTLNVNLIMESFAYPSINIVGKVEGTDPVLSKEYVLLSGHPDAHGIRNMIGNDSIYHGADDNVSVNVAMLATARALKKFPGKRSALLVIHGAEEVGLVGSRWFSSHPTVPLSSIVAVLNGDMIGRNHPDSAALLGSQPPHRSSMDLVNMALEANVEGPQFKLDSLWDKPTHVEGWFFRSDHLPYARLNVPSLMYSTLLHPDYHTPQDNAQNIDYEKLLKMTQWIYRTAWKVANADKRPAVDSDYKLER